MDLNRVAAVILAGGKGQRLEPLTRDRAKPAVPFGGIYRIIDFALSNCINAGLKKIAVLVQYRSRSLNRHIRDGWQIMFNPAVGEYLETNRYEEREAEKGRKHAARGRKGSRLQGERASHAAMLVQVPLLCGSPLGCSAGAGSLPAFESVRSSAKR